MNNKLLLFGAGGHCRSVLDSINQERYSDIVIIDMPEKVGGNVFSIPIAGTDDDIDYFYERGYTQAVITMGSIGNPNNRINLYNRLKEKGFCFPSVIDPTAIISKRNVDIGDGVFIGKGVIINTGNYVGNFSIINTGAIIDHDCKIGRFVHIAPGVRLSGNVNVQDNTHIGIGVTVIQSISIGQNTIIGAGSVVVSDIAKASVAYGVPCKISATPPPHTHHHTTKHVRT